MVIIAFSILTVWGYSLTALMFGGFVFENMHPSFKPKDIAVHQSCLGVSLFELELKRSDGEVLIRTGEVLFEHIRKSAKCIGCIQHSSCPNRSQAHPLITDLFCIGNT